MFHYRRRRRRRRVRINLVELIFNIRRTRRPRSVRQNQNSSQKTDCKHIRGDYFFHHNPAFIIYGDLLLINGNLYLKYFSKF